MEVMKKRIFDHEFCPTANDHHREFFLHHPESTVDVAKLTSMWRDWKFCLVFEPLLTDSFSFEIKMCTVFEDASLETSVHHVDTSSVVKLWPCEHLSPERGARKTVRKEWVMVYAVPQFDLSRESFMGSLTFFEDDFLPSGTITRPLHDSVVGSIIVRPEKTDKRFLVKMWDCVDHPQRSYLIRDEAVCRGKAPRSRTYWLTNLHKRVEIARTKETFQLVTLQFFRSRVSVRQMVDQSHLMFPMINQ